MTRSTRAARPGGGIWSRAALLAPLRHGPFRLLYAGQVISNLGDWLDLLALLTLIAYRWRLGAAALAALTMAQLLPLAVVAPLAGVLVDRWPRRATMLGCDLGRAAIVLGLVWAPHLPAVVALVLAKMTLSTFFDPARQVAIRATVPEDDLLAASSLGRLSVNATKVLGPALGGLLVAATGPRAAFVADALTFLASAAILSRLPRLAPAAAPDGGRRAPRFWREFRAGFACIVRYRPLAIAVAAATAEMLIVESNDSLTVLAFKGLGMGEALVGLAIGASGLGNVAGALALGQWGRRVPALGLMGGGKVLVGVVELGIGGALVAGLAGGGAWVPLIVVNGIGFAAIWVAYGYILQRETPPDLLGRVSAAATALQTAAGLAGPPLGAYLARRLGVGPVYLITGAALTLVGLLVVLAIPAARPAPCAPAADAS